MLRACLLLIYLCFCGAAVAAESRPNVLFIAVDDLRPELNCYGKDLIHSPHIDRLARQGTRFERAYCMVPTCGASRASMMTGVRPAPNRFVNYLAWAERDAPDAPTMNAHFRANGYRTVSLGKVFHHPTDSEEGWSKPAWRPRGIPTYRVAENQQLHRQRQQQEGRRRGPAWEAGEVEDDAYIDGQIARQAIAELGQLGQRDEPFFLAVGFLKPHLPFVAPKKYWDLYDEADVEVPENYHAPQDAPAESIHSFGELRAYAGIPAKGPVSDEQARKLIHGYYACVSYTDAQIGRVLAELDRLGLAENTIVVLWGDHGWNLGEHTLWCKHCCFETSMRIPLIVRNPGANSGQVTSGLTESIDIYPSLCELAGLPVPEHVEGRSFVPLLKDPGRAWKEAAVGRYRTGDTIRTEQFRFTEFAARGDKHPQMLYDHDSDADENVNVVEREEYRDEVKRLRGELRQLKGKPTRP